MALEAQVECPECAGQGAIAESECPVCDGHGSVEGEARTISLHNIRYEWRWRGDDLWQAGDGRELLVGLVRRMAGGERWAGSCGGHLVKWFADEETARVAVETAVKRGLEGV